MGSLAIVTPFYPPHVGGVERYAQEFAQAAVDLGVDVNVVTTDNVRDPIENIDDRGVRVLRLPAYNIPVMGSTYPIALRGWRRAADLLRCDAIMAHTRFFMTTPVAAALAARSGRRICVVDHGSGPLRSSPRALARASLAYEHMVTAILKPLSPRFFAVSAASANWLRTFGIKEAEVLPNSIVPRAIPLARSTSDFRGKMIVLHAGRLFAEKGVLDLVEAARIFSEARGNIELRIAGDGPLRGVLEQYGRASTFLTYLGSIPHDQVRLELERATVYVHPSKLAEGFPTALLEAGDAGLPVISTPFGGSAELIEDGSTGWILDRSDPTTIASALFEVASRPEEAIRRGYELRKAVHENYTWPSTVAKFLRYVGTAA